MLELLLDSIHTEPRHASRARLSKHSIDLMTRVRVVPLRFQRSPHWALRAFESICCVLRPFADAPRPDVGQGPHRADLAPVNPVLIDARTGALTAVVATPWHVRALEESRPLHFGDCGGPPLKILRPLLGAIIIGAARQRPVSVVRAAPCHAKTPIQTGLGSGPTDGPRLSRSALHNACRSLPNSRLRLVHRADL